jgi:hypothetical protein
MQLVNLKDIPGRHPRNSLTAKELRERLFKKSRPQARRLEILDGDQYSKDMGVLWAAYKAGSFSMPTLLSQEDFVKLIEESFKEFQHMWVIDDDNNAFSSKRGPVALVGANSVNLIVEPKFLFFKWASKRNALRSVVAFLNMIRNSKKTGIALVRTTKDKMTLPDHLKKYDMLYFIGKSAENEYLYTVRGRGTEIKE